ncbi:MAG: histidine kinase [Deltaproteobacteria bacterium SG8_13]|nr:MAG: histidine kinase [Deltaproteobacteria bacterium SG8_13]
MKNGKQTTSRHTATDEFEGLRRLLVIDDEQNMRHMLSVMLKKSGYRVETAADGLEGLAALDKKHYDFILCDIKMPNMGGMEFLESAREKLQDTTVIVMSAYGSIDTAIEAMKLGAYDYISKPFKSDEVHLTLKKAEERESLKKENLLLKERIRKIGRENRFGNMIGKSKPMQSVFQLAEKVAQYDTTVLITGESGTGKELIARGIHFQGRRSNGPLVPVNCGGIPETLLESELFGYVKGAFTGADKNKKGLFEEAQGGTIFLDEIGELPMSLQVKLLRVLQENEIRPVGGAKTRQVDARVIAATAKNLEEEIGRGNFREDLFYRLNVMPIQIPPLRDRAEDIPLLCQAFIGRFNRSLKRRIAEVSPAALSHLMKHGWPGNVRELENAIERAMVFAEGKQLKPEHFPPEIGKGTQADPVGGLIAGFSLKEAQRVLEKKLIVKALEETGGNRTRAAKLLEISHPSLLSKIKTYKIDM